MSSAQPSELSARHVLTLIRSNAYPRDVILTIARGFLPLPQEDLIFVLAELGGSFDPEIAEAARASLSDIPTRVVLGVASNEQADATHLTALLTVTRDTPILEALIRNRAVPDEAIVELARHAEGPVQEVIVINHARILRAPQILDALMENPALSAEARRRALEAREEFFDKKARLRELQQEFGEDVVQMDMPDDPIADLLAQAEELEGGASASDPNAVPPDDDERSQSIFKKILTMTVSQKVQLAFKGDKTVRMILIRDRNKLVCSATMRNPRMTENEVESIAGMRNVEEEVLRLLGNRRDWTSKYNIALALIRNPKAPVGVVLPLINRLNLRDLKSLKDDKGVSEAVRVNARKFYLAKNK